MKARAARLALLLFMLAPLFGACASKPDTRYRASVDNTQLTIPAGLDTPVYTRAMEIPPASRVAAPEVVEDSDIEKPPTLSGMR